MSIIKHTPRLVIREYLTNELETYLDHFTDDRVTLHIPKRSREERVAIFNNALSQYAVNKTVGMWGMFDSITGEFIGGCLLRPFDDKAGTSELGYSLEHKYWGDGLATEMAIALLAHGFADTTTAEIAAVTTPGNKASQRVLEKAGFMQGDNIIRDDEELTFFRASR